MLLQTVGAAVFAACALTTAALAQAAPQAGPMPGFSAGDFVVRLGAAAVLPLDDDSRVPIIGGTVHATDSYSPEVDISYYFSDHFAVELIAASTRHDVSVQSSILGPRLDLGSTWVLPPVFAIQYHPMPHAVISPYVGFGLNLSFFYDTNPNTPPIDKLRLSNGAGPVFEVGLDYNIYGPWFINVDYKQVIVHVDADVYALGTVVHAQDMLNPGVASVGIEYRF